MVRSASTAKGANGTSRRDRADFGSPSTTPPPSWPSWTRERRTTMWGRSPSRVMSVHRAPRSSPRRRPGQAERERSRPGVLGGGVEERCGFVLGPCLHLLHGLWEQVDHVGGVADQETLPDGGVEQLAEHPQSQVQDGLGVGCQAGSAEAAGAGEAELHAPWLGGVP